VRPWRDHLEPDDPLVVDARVGAAGLTAGGTLLHIWSGLWSSAPTSRLWHEGGLHRVCARCGEPARESAKGA